MINLLPPDAKEAITYARRNTALARWSFILLAGLISLIIVTLAGQLYINQSIESYRTQVAQGQQQLKVQGMEQTQKRLTDISASLKLVVQVLGQQVLFSKLVQQVGTVIPNGAVLTDLNISQVGGGIDLKAATLNQATATQVQVNLLDPSNKIFDKVDIVNINCGSSLYGDKYPCTVQLRAAFAKCNPFLFINNTTGCNATVKKS
jgi:Tfp pilus assembly protein PilN